MSSIAAIWADLSSLADRLPPNLLILGLATLLDRLIGDPVTWLHPVQVMGWYISGYTAVVTIPEQGDISKSLPRFSPWLMRYLGAILTGSLVLGSGVTAWAIAISTNLLHPLLGTIVASILLASCFAAKSLGDAAQSVLVVLATGDITQARQELSRYVGRDTDDLSESEILRAVMETVTENAIDAVTAPLFYALVGSYLFDYGGVTLAIAYKAASTLDSMVGYQVSPYTDLGWCSAKTDDILTWLPCRLTVLTLALCSGRPLAVWRICRRDAHLDPSPNSGWSECVYAAILQVQVGGENRYRGVVKLKPLLGDAIAPITPLKIRQALALTNLCMLLWLGLAAGMIIFAFSH
ncbi:MAG: adenosylcobinamide-phosphate synthase CbiB [Pseudanabaenaceae cyanobacterium bins.39]|nr:adenosylcobinamide-phosphate synthase CbiB [Pseudanabaenaceae cyanobacterium bins.39]